MAQSSLKHRMNVLEQELLKLKEQIKTPLGKALVGRALRGL